MASETIYLTPQQLSDRWNGTVKVKTLGNWRYLKRGPPYRRIGSSILYPLPAVEAFEASREFKSTDEYGKKSRRKAT